MYFKLAEIKWYDLITWQHAANQPKSISCDTIVIYLVSSKIVKLKSLWILLSLYSGITWTSCVLTFLVSTLVWSKLCFIAASKNLVSTISSSPYFKFWRRKNIEKSLKYVSLHYHWWVFNNRLINHIKSIKNQPGKV